MTFLTRRCRMMFGSQLDSLGHLRHRRAYCTRATIAPSNGHHPPTSEGPREFMKVDVQHVEEYITYHPDSFIGAESSAQRLSATATTSRNKTSTRQLQEILPGTVEGIVLANTFQDTLIDVMRRKHRVSVGAWCLGPSIENSLIMWNIKTPFCTPVFSTQMMFYDDTEEAIEGSKDGESVPKENINDATRDVVWDIPGTRTTSFDMAFTFRLAEDVPLQSDSTVRPKPLTFENFDAVFPTLLFLGSRFPHCAPHLAAHVADLAGICGMVLGNGFPLIHDSQAKLEGFFPPPPDWVDYGGVLLLNEDPIAVGRGSQNLFGRGPVEAAIELVRLLREQKRTRKQLKKGTLLCAGPCSNHPISIQLAQSIHQDRRLRLASANTEDENKTDCATPATTTKLQGEHHGTTNNAAQEDELKVPQAGISKLPQKMSPSISSTLTAAFGPIGKVTVRLKGLN